MSIDDAVYDEVYKGIHIKVYPDDTPMNPFEEWDFPESFGLAVDFDVGIDPLGIRDLLSEFASWTRDELDDEDLVEWFNKFNRQYEWTFVHKYEHSGVAYSVASFSCPWDSGVVGIAYVRRDDDQVFIDHGLYLKEQVELLSQYANGEVYGYIAVGVDEEGNEDEDKWYDSCWGFYGYEHMMWHIVSDVKVNIDEFVNPDNFKLQS